MIVNRDKLIDVLQVKANQYENDQAEFREKTKYLAEDLARIKQREAMFCSDNMVLDAEREEGEIFGTNVTL